MLPYKASTRCLKKKQNWTLERRDGLFLSCRTTKQEHCLTYRVAQGKVVALRCKDGVQARLAVSALWAGHHQGEHAHQRKHCHLDKIKRWESHAHKRHRLSATERQKKGRAGANLGNQDAPEEGPDDVAKVQQHHVLEEQRRQSKLGHKVAQTLGLVLRDDVSPFGEKSKEQPLAPPVIKTKRGRGGRGGFIGQNHTCQRCSHTL